MDKLTKVVFALFAAPFVLLALVLILPVVALTLAAILAGVFILPLVVFFVLIPLFMLHGAYESSTGTDRRRRRDIREYHIRWNE